RRAARDRAHEGSCPHRRQGESSRDGSSALTCAKGLALSGGRGRRVEGPALSERRGRRRVEGKIDDDFRPVAGTARDRNRAAQALDDVLGDRQTETGPAALCREIRIEDVG